MDDDLATYPLLVLGANQDLRRYHYYVLGLDAPQKINLAILTKT